jgi:hypothetical protein
MRTDTKTRTGGKILRYMIAMWTSLLLSTGIASAQFLPERCQNYTAGNTGAPKFIGLYLSHSRDSYVQACAIRGEQYYFAATDVSRYNDICHFSLYTLTLSHGSVLTRKGAARNFISLQMAHCPPPSPNSYIEIEDTTDQTAQRLVHLWMSTASSLGAFDRAFSGLPTDATASSRFQKLRAIVRTDSQQLSVRKVALVHDFGIWKQYSIEISSRNDSSQYFIVGISAWFGMYYYISEFSVLTI